MSRPARGWMGCVSGCRRAFGKGNRGWQQEKIGWLKPITKGIEGGNLKKALHFLCWRYPAGMASHAETCPKTPLNFNPEALLRETARHYIPASGEDAAAMLDAIGLGSVEELFAHIPEDIRYAGELPVPEELSYEELQEAMEALAAKNRPALSFIGDALPDYTVHEVVAYVAGIRNLTTAYTPYQPERSQGTLISHWIYQCLMAKLTGFEAINSSLYDRSTALFEAICTAIRLGRRGQDTVLLAGGLHPGDLEVVRTLAADTDIHLVELPLDPASGVVEPEAVRAKAAEIGRRLAAVAFMQVNNLGLCEEVDALTDLAAELQVSSIAMIDPVQIATGGLKPPRAFGAAGADIMVGEAQHLALAPNFGGPGLGLFGVRHGEGRKNMVRATPGRYVGKAEDTAGRECAVMVMSTREQHIRKDKATSNICSNQAFLATAAGAALLARGDAGLAEMARKGRERARDMAGRLCRLPGVELAYPERPFFNEVTLRLPLPAAQAIEAARKEGIHLGVDVSDRAGAAAARTGNLLKLAFSDVQVDADLDRLEAFFAQLVPGEPGEAPSLPEPGKELLREGPAGLPAYGTQEVKDYYARLGEQNVSPDNGCYPLGSCTMKYNPFINDWAAGLPGFAMLHPQAPLEDAQGSLQLLYEIQEWFKGITGLAGVTTQPVAGAQGELVGLKLFQAYLRERGETGRDVVFIPKSAHGTNFATAVMAGFPNRKVDGRQAGIVLLENDQNGRVDMADFDAKLDEHRDHLAGVMITNPNTGGIFETEFRAIADKVHEAGGLVYMDGANMNAIAGWLDLGKMGVDAVHNNLHKTWTIPHGGGGPGDAIVAVSERLVDFLPGHQITKEADGRYVPVKPEKSIGSFHRHWGNFAHKVRAYTYLLRLGRAGVRRMAATSVLSARYLHERLRGQYPSLPRGADAVPRMHEFILTLREEDFERLEAAGILRNMAMPRIGKLFLDFGFHAPTVAFPEVFGLMIEPTESYTRAELDRFAEAVIAISEIVRESPETLAEVPHFTPIDRVDEVAANRNLVLWEELDELPPLHRNRIEPETLLAMPLAELKERILGQPETV